MKNTKIFQNRLIIMDDLPRWKMERVFRMVKTIEIFQSDEKCKDFSKWFHFNEQPTQIEDCQGGEKYKDFSK
jgi:hypothetical protein